MTLCYVRLNVYWFHFRSHQFGEETKELVVFFRIWMFLLIAHIIVFWFFIISNFKRVKGLISLFRTTTVLATKKLKFNKNEIKATYLFLFIVYFKPSREFRDRDANIRFINVFNRIIQCFLQSKWKSLLKCINNFWIITELNR